MGAVASHVLASGLGNGLPNVGNSCYQASLMQALYPTPFAKAIRALVKIPTVRDALKFRAPVTVAAANIWDGIEGLVVTDRARLMRELRQAVADAFLVGIEGMNERNRNQQMALQREWSSSHQKDSSELFGYMKGFIERELEAIPNRASLFKQVGFDLTQDIGFPFVFMKEEEMRFSEIEVDDYSKSMLVVSLPRLQWQGSISRNPIPFPIQTHLNNSNFILDSAVVHSGSASGGHYTAYRRSGDEWVYCSDFSVTAAGRQPFSAGVQQGVYMLIYRNGREVRRVEELRRLGGRKEVIFV